MKLKAEGYIKNNARNAGCQRVYRKNGSAINSKGLRNVAAHGSKECSGRMKDCARRGWSNMPCYSTSLAICYRSVALLCLFALSSLATTRRRSSISEICENPNILQAGEKTRGARFKNHYSKCRQVKHMDKARSGVFRRQRTLVTGLVGSQLDQNTFFLKVGNKYINSQIDTLISLHAQYARGTQTSRVWSIKQSLKFEVSIKFQVNNATNQ